MDADYISYDYDFHPSGFDSGFNLDPLQVFPYNNPTPPETPTTPLSPVTSPVEIFVSTEGTKFRAEKQFDVELKVIDRSSRPNHAFQHLQFPQRLLHKFKQGKDTDPDPDSVLCVEPRIVLASAVCTQKSEFQAKRRARRDEYVPHRRGETPPPENDPAHPQNGGEVLMCKKCEQREKTRCERKRKRGEAENKWIKSLASRMPMISANEYEKLHDKMEEGMGYKQAVFQMRIPCYGRHQERNPQGYKVIWTFRRKSDNEVVEQIVSGVFTITDDHKTKDAPIAEASHHIVDAVPTQQFINPAPNQQLFGADPSQQFINSTDLTQPFINNSGLAPWSPNYNASLADSSNFCDPTFTSTFAPDPYSAGLIPNAPYQFVPQPPPAAWSNNSYAAF